MKIFIEIWTLKESYIKCVGKGLNMPLDKFSINIRDHNEIFVDDEFKSEYSFAEIKLDGYKLSICFSPNKDKIKKDIKFVTVNDIDRFWSNNNIEI